MLITKVVWVDCIQKKKEKKKKKKKKERKKIKVKFFLFFEIVIQMLSHHLSSF